MQSECNVNLNTSNQTYNVQGDLRRYRLKRYIQQQQTVLSKVREGIVVDENDPILSYDIEADNRISREKRQEEPDPERYYKERRVVMNINSRTRRPFILEPLSEQELSEQHPEIREAHWDGDRNLYKAPDKAVRKLNQKALKNRSLGPSADNVIAGTNNNGKHKTRTKGSGGNRGHEFDEPYAVRNNEICQKVSQDDNPNSYIFVLDHVLHNIKSGRLLSTEIPQILPAVSHSNNIILVDLVTNLDTFESVDFIPAYTLPFLLVVIPPGNYSLDELVETIQERLNAMIETYTTEHYQNLFKILADQETDSVMIQLCPPEGTELYFHFRFSQHPHFEQLSLHYMLGFKSPFPTNTDGSNAYLKEWSNLVEEETHQLLGVEVARKRPFRPIDLQPHKYIYLAIRGFQTITDPFITGYDLFAKILLNRDDNSAQKTIFNTFICNPKIFLDSPERLLAELRIDWVDAFGQPVDFQHQEHSMTIEFVQYLDYLVDSNYSSLRGTRDPTSFTESSLHH